MSHVVDGWVSAAVGSVRSFGVHPMRSLVARVAGSLAILAAVTATSGCASEAASSDEGVVDSSEAAIGEAATIRFRGDYRVEVSGDLQRTKSVRIAYDTDRLTTCRGEQYGHAAWLITGFYRIGGGAVRTFEAGGFSPSNGTSPPVIALDAAGDLEVWFQNTSVFGCSGFDSNYGQNYHFDVKPAAKDPGFIGNHRYVISRMTCNDGKACDSDMRVPNGEIVYDSWARSRAAIQSIFFEVWKDGVTDRDNADLWQQLDVQVHSRPAPAPAASASASAFKTEYVSFDKRVGNNARYALSMRTIDPIPGLWTLQTADQCPSFPLTVAADGNGAYVETTVEYYFTVNGVEFRPAGGGTFRIRFQNYTQLFAPCVAHD